MSSLLRSTKLVRYFAGAARTLILNSAKTAETNLLINSKALCVANNAISRNYATKKAESLEPLLQRLDSEVRRFGRISKRDIDEVFDELRAKNNITSSQSLLVIRCCGEMVPEELPEQRTLLVQKIWSVLTERGVPMDISHYNALLRVYIENEHPFSPAEFLAELEKKGLQANRVTYQRLMWRYCQEGDVEGATKVLEKMRELGFPVSEPVLNALVMGHAFHGDTDGAKAVLETMAGAGLQPSNRTYTLLACGFAKKGDLEGVENVLKMANEKDAYIIDKDILDIMESLALSGHGDKIESLFKHLQKGVGYNQDVSNLIIRLINKGHEKTAMEIMNTMPKSEHFEHNMYKGAFFVKQLIKVHKSPEFIVKICRELQQNDMVPSAIYIATENALEQGLVELAQLLFKELKKDGIEIRQHYYWPLLVKKVKENDEEGLLQILKEMSGQGLLPTGEALRDYVLPYLLKKDSPQNVMLKLQIANVPAIQSARNVMVELLEAGKIREAAQIAIQYRPFGQFSLVGRPLSSALLKTKDVKSFVSILHVISSKVPSESDATNDEHQNDDKHDSHVIGRLVLTAVKNIQPTQYDELFSELLYKGLSISTASAEAIEVYLGTKLTSAISEKLAQLTSPDLKIAPLEILRRSNEFGSSNTSPQLEKLLLQAKAQGTNVSRLQKQLMAAYMNEKDITKLNNFLKDMEIQDLSNANLAQLIEFYAENDDLESALRYKEILDKREPKFLLNKIKLVQLAYSFVRADRYDDAIRLLKNNKPDEHENSIFLLNSKCWQMLNALAEKKDPAKVKEMTKVLIDEEIIEPNNVLHGPSIKVHLLANDIEGALKEFEHNCKQYRTTPWKGELMKALILKEDATKLQWLADLSTQIHGEVNVLHDLVLAFVECGRLRQARRILETPGMQTKQKRLQDACERYVQEGKSEYLEGLLEATKELSYIDRSNIFYHLLVSYCKANETDKALGLWTLLQEEGEIPSEQFLQYLGQHLRLQNREVPFVIPNEKNKPKLSKDSDKKNTTVLSKNEYTDLIERLTQAGKAEEAMDKAVKAIKEGVIPKSNVLKYTLRALADAGNVGKIEAFGELINPAIKRNVTYDDKLILAIFVNGSGPQYLKDLYESISNAKTKEEIEKVVLTFPKSNALAFIMNDDSLVDKCTKIAEIAHTKGFSLPLNLIWMECILAGKDKEADTIWNKYLINVPSIAFRRLLQESHVKNKPHLIEKLITYLKTNSNITPAIMGNAYSRLINLHITYGNTEDAKLILEKAISEGIGVENMSNATISRLRTAMETIGQEFKYTT